MLAPPGSKEKDGEASARLRLLPENRSGQYRLIPDVEHGPHGPDAKEAYLHPQSSEDFYDEILHSVGFNLFISGLIVANAIVIGLETDNQEEELWAIMEFVFLGIFTVELILRLIVSGPKKFFSYQNDDFSWNLFDFCVVFAGCLDVISDMSPVRHTKGSFMTFLRIIRLLRVMRMIRLLRFLRDFHVLTFGFAAAAVAIRNVSLLMLAAIYVSSTMLVRVILPFMQDNDHQEFLDAHFGTLRKSMLSLFFLLSEPDLMPYWEVLKDDGLLAAFLICFVVFVSFGIVGLLTGLVCESMFDKNDARVEQERAEAEEKRQRIIKNCEKIFETIASSQGHAAIEDIMQILPELDALFVEEGVTFAREDLVNTVNCMDTDGSNSIDRNEFCHSILHLAEGLRPISIMELHYLTSQTKMKVDRCENLLALIAPHFEPEAARDIMKQAPRKPRRKEPPRLQVQKFGSGNSASKETKDGRSAGEQTPPAPPALSKDVLKEVFSEMQDLPLPVAHASLNASLDLTEMRQLLDSAKEDMSSQMRSLQDAAREVHHNVLKEVSSMQLCVSTTLQSLAQQNAAHVESLARCYGPGVPPASAPVVTPPVPALAPVPNFRTHHVSLQEELDTWKRSFFMDLEAFRGAANANASSPSEKALVTEEPVRSRPDVTLRSKISEARLSERSTPSSAASWPASPDITEATRRWKDALNQSSNASPT